MKGRETKAEGATNGAAGAGDQDAGIAYPCQIRIACRRQRRPCEEGMPVNRDGWIGHSLSIEASAYCWLRRRAVAHLSFSRTNAGYCGARMEGARDPLDLRHW